MQPEQNLHNFKYSQTNTITISSNGARIMGLVLDGVTVIQAQQPFDGTGSGNFLMYPWVNRLEKVQQPYQPVLLDGNGLPIHGVVINTPVIIQSKQNEKSLIITIKPKQLNPPQLPSFTQVFTLQPGKLTIHFTIDGKSNLPICFGYHPYLQIDNYKLTDLVIDTNITINIKLDDKTLLPVIPFLEAKININSASKYDHLFKNTQNQDVYFRLVHQGGRTVEIRSSDMKYWQIYTPPDGKRIAVEPMTFMGNVYSLYTQEKYGKLPDQASFTIQIK